MQKKTVLVLGGGAAGHQIAYLLRNDADVTLVDPKTYWEVPMAVPRLLVDQDGLDARIPYKSFLGTARHLQGKVVAIDDRSANVVLADGTERTVKFDYAVIATGSRYLDPLIKAEAHSEDERAAEIQRMYERLRAARSVVVVGGGPVGIETAAELRETLPHLKVTIVHGGGTLLDKAPSKFPAWSQQDLRSKGVDLVLNDLVVAPSIGEQPLDGKVETASGRTIPADAIIWATGTEPVTDFVAESWPGAVDNRGLVKVDEYLRVVGHPGVFAVGDTTNLPENRLAIIAGLHAKSVAANIRKLSATPAGAKPALKPYKPAVPGKGMGKMMIVTLGRDDGLTSLPFGQFRASFLARKIKSRDMLVGMSRKAVGL